MAQLRNCGLAARKSPRWLSETKRHARADSFPVRAEIARHIRSLEQRLAAIDSDLNEKMRSGDSSEPQPLTVGCGCAAAVCPADRKSVV